MRLLRNLLLLLVVVLAVGLLALKLLYGRGQPYPSLATPVPAGSGDASVIATLDFPPGNVAVSSDGRTFVNLHPFAQAKRFGVPTLYELRGGKLEPFPSAQAQSGFQGIFGMTVDAQNRLWVVEPAGLDHERSKVSAIDLAQGRVVFEYAFERGTAGFVQDLRVSRDGRTVVLADTGLFKFTQPGLWVLDVDTRKLLRRLASHPSTQPQDWVMRTPFGLHRLGYGLITFAVGLDGLEISADDQWLYYAAMTHDSLYRVPLAMLRDPGVDDAALSARIEALGKKPMSDGITLDREGRVILTDVENGGLMRRDVDGKLVTIVSDKRIVWADGVVQAPDGALLFTDSAIPAYIDQLARPPALERLQAGGPYRVWRSQAR